MKVQPDVSLESQGLMLFKKRIVVPKGQMVDEVLTEAHKGQYTIHPGAIKMYQYLIKNFWWSCMKKDIAKFVNMCLVCQKVKIKHQRPSGLLQSLDIPEWKWVMKISFSAEQLACLYVKETVKLHGVLETIISDRDPKFTSRFWNAL
ncbi:uncharacterized protein LOC133312992 [Gastrolobium bilobum]|uniref:uncharacterized protein LOC133312992 n=1 Tax=Gastrolobium bilobum TaxID=150636 RepID=UPI002AB16151|nr:uncharacterized protein LOC133312992 [Gastrolobium bilobum]